VSANIRSMKGDQRRDVSQQRYCAVAILHVGGAHLPQQRPAIGVDQGMSLASLGLLGRVIVARATCFGGLDSLAVVGGALVSLPFPDFKILLERFETAS
jgi:hypothetical protein